MPILDLKANARAVREYFEALKQYQDFGIEHEGGVRTAFHNLLDYCARQFGWIVAAERKFQRPGRRPARLDGVLVDSFGLEHGYWEAKDIKDNLDKEIPKKFADGYPDTNILFQTPHQAILYQNGQLILKEDIRHPHHLIKVLKAFLEYRRPSYEKWEQAVTLFQEQVPNLAQSLFTLIDKERNTNRAFRDALDKFSSICRNAINPDLSDNAIKEMLVQHLLTERIFRKIFNNPDFTERNVIAVEIEKVIKALTSKSFSRDLFLRQCDNFYIALEETASTIEDFSYKQFFLNVVYERFFQSFSRKMADTHGIVYTPQEIVDFMVNSVQVLLQQEFNCSLSDKGVSILDPFVGTGNFMVRVMREINRRALPDKYRDELHCNEVMLLPYYIASMNIEHSYFEKTNQYEPFPGICLVDTFELYEGDTPPLFAEENTERIKRQKSSPIFVIIGNPPYNVGQLNENDNNKNRKYTNMDKRVSTTYAHASNATNKNALSDVYVKAIRWASDRLNDNKDNKQGIVAFVTNNSFIKNISCDGMRQHLAQDFSKIYHIDLKGNARSSGEDRKREGGNVFDDQIRVSVGITFFVRKNVTEEPFELHIFSIEDYKSAEDKKRFLAESKSLAGIKWQKAVIDSHYNWLTAGLHDEFEDFISLGTKEAKANDKIQEVIFRQYTRGILTCRDAWAYNFSSEALKNNIRTTIDFYNLEVHRYNSLKESEKKKITIDNFVTYDDQKISWSRDLKADLKRERYGEYTEEKFRTSIYRPFTSTQLFFDRIMNEEVYLYPTIFPTPNEEKENLVICCNGIGSEKPFTPIVSNQIVNISFLGGGTGLQCFPFYTYLKDKEEIFTRHENITDWALAKFREHYQDFSITKWDIFHYTYGLLHHPIYRETFAANLKKELARLPLWQPFREITEIGGKLADLHVNYESQPEYRLKEVENPNTQATFRVEKMRLSPDKTELIYNNFLILKGIPVEVYEYKLGNRSALEWIIERYQITQDKRSGIINDPNREDDEQYILRLIGQVITLSLETVKLVNRLKELGGLK